MNVDGTLYKKPCALVLDMVQDFPMFGNLMDIFILNSQKVYSAPRHKPGFVYTSVSHEWLKIFLSNKHKTFNISYCLYLEL